MTSLDQPAVCRPSVESPGRASALHSLPSATLAVGSAAAFLVLAMLLSFVPERGADRVAVDHPADRTRADQAADAAGGWHLRGSLPPDDPVPQRERLAQRAPS